MGGRGVVRGGCGGGWGLGGLWEGLLLLSQSGGLYEAGREEIGRVKKEAMKEKESYV